MKPETINENSSRPKMAGSVNGYNSPIESAVDSAAGVAISAVMVTALIFAVVTALTSFVGIKKAHALPLLSENAARDFISDEALTIYPDSSDPNKFYYFPNTSTLTEGKDGTPEFSLAYTGIDADLPDAQGLMTATFHLKSNKRQVDAIQMFLQRNKKAGVAVLPVMASTLGAGDPAKPMSIFKSIDLPQHGGLPDSDVGFSCELNKMGVKLMRAQIMGDTAKGLQACYKVQGLGPNMDAHVTIHWSQVYDYLKASASGGYWWWHVDVSRVVETLRTQGVINIVINGGTAKEQDYVNKIADQMIEKFFKADLSASPGSAGSTIFNETPLQLNVSSVHKEDVKDFEGNWIIRDLVEHEFCLDMNLHDVAPYAKTKVIDADKPGQN